MDTPHAREIIWHESILPRRTRQALDYLSKQAWLKRSSWYLAGGTALALQAGHRLSLDLDFFTPQKDFSSGKLVGHFSKDAWMTDILREGTIYGRLMNAKISFIAYPFFIARKPPLWFGSVRVLDLEDIAVMKIIAISQRGLKRDFVDLFWFSQHHLSLGEIMRRLPDQYPTVSHDYHHILKSLTYFADAEHDPMPNLFFKATWKEIKSYFRKEVPRITRELLKLQA